MCQVRRVDEKVEVIVLRQLLDSDSLHVTLGVL